MKTLAITALVMAGASSARADCVNSGIKTLQGVVQSCRIVDPLHDPRLTKALAAFSQQDKKHITNAYQGIEVVNDGERVFIPASSGQTCSSYPPGQKVALDVQRACCDGDPNPPCYLGYDTLIRPGSPP